MKDNQLFSRRKGLEGKLEEPHWKPPNIFSKKFRRCDD